MSTLGYLDSTRPLSTATFLIIDIPQRDLQVDDLISSMAWCTVESAQIFSVEAAFSFRIRKDKASYLRLETKQGRRMQRCIRLHTEVYYDVYGYKVGTAPVRLLHSRPSRSTAYWSSPNFADGKDHRGDAYEYYICAASSIINITRT